MKILFCIVLMLMLLVDLLEEILRRSNYAELKDEIEELKKELMKNDKQRKAD